jgi:hypothetical protein
VLTALPRLLAERGFDPDTVLLPLGLAAGNPVGSDRPDRISARCATSFRHCADLTGIGHFGHDRRGHANILSMFWSLAACGVQRRQLCARRWTHSAGISRTGDRGAMAAIGIHAGEARFSYAMFNPSRSHGAATDPGSRHGRLPGQSCASALRIAGGARSKSALAIRPRPIPHPMHGDPALPGAVRCAPRTELVFDPAWLDAPVADPDPITRDLIDEPSARNWDICMDPELVAELRGADAVS